MKDWYQYRAWNLLHRAQLGESGHMTYLTFALQRNSQPNGLWSEPLCISYQPSTYISHFPRIDIEGHIPVHLWPVDESCITWMKSGLPSVEIAASQWQSVNFWIPRVCPIYTTNIERIDKWFISSHPPNLFNWLSLRISCDMEWVQIIMA